MKRNENFNTGYVKLQSGELLILWFCVCRYNPYVQARGRIDQLKRLGHSVDKVWPVSLFRA